jgi:hypothetical protein
MTVRSAAFLLLLCAWPLTALRAEPASLMQVEVDYLLSYVETSNCSFYRNGSWYDGAQAKAHLRTKYDYLVAQHSIASADEFIDKGASSSSFSGKPYKIKCGTSAEVASGPWFHEALRRFRAARPSY